MAQNGIGRAGVGGLKGERERGRKREREREKERKRKNNAEHSKCCLWH